MYALFNISPLYTVKYVSAANGAHRHRMHDDERTDAVRSYLPRKTKLHRKSDRVLQRGSSTKMQPENGSHLAPQSNGRCSIVPAADCGYVIDEASR